MLLLAFAISLPAYALARLLGEGLLLLTPHNPIGAGVVAGGAVMALISILALQVKESK